MFVLAVFSLGVMSYSDGPECSDIFMLAGLDRHEELFYNGGQSAHAASPCRIALVCLVVAS